MKGSENIINQNGGFKWVSSGLLAAFSASLCCITPVLALVSGTSGMAATFSWAEPLRPYLIGLTTMVLGLAWYQKLKPDRQDEKQCDCENDGKEPFIQSKKFLSIVTIIAMALLTFPSYSHLFYPDNIRRTVEHTSIVNIQQVNLKIKGMTCAGCEEHIKHASYQVEGVLNVESTYEKRSASIVFDSSKASMEEIEKAVNSTGYSITNYRFVEPSLNYLERTNLIPSEKELR